MKKPNFSRFTFHFSWQWLSLNRRVTAIVFIALFAMAIRYPADSDTWWHMRAGQWMLDNRQLLMADVFSFTRGGAAWINHSWLAQLVWYGLLSMGGWPLVGLALAAIVTASFGLVWRQSDGNLYVRAFAVLLAAIVSSVVWAARPQMLSFLLAALTAYLLNRFKRRGGSLMPWLPLVVLVWVNLHGGFAIAFILLMCYLAGETFNALSGQAEARARLKPLLAATGVSLLVVPLNPNGWRMGLYPFQTVGIGVLRNFIAEWQSPNFHEPLAQAFLLMLLLVLAAIARSGRQVDWTDLALLGVWTAWAMLAVRNVAIFALVAAPVLSRYGTAALEAHFGPLRLGRPRPPSVPLAAVNWVLLGLLLVATVVQAGQTLSPVAIRQAEAERFPADMVAFIRQNRPPGPMFNSYNIGGYLLYHLWPDYPVFVDGRTDLYDDAFLRHYLQTINGLPGWQATLDENHIGFLALEIDTPLAQILSQQPGWQAIYRDDQAIVFVRE